MYGGLFSIQCIQKNIYIWMRNLLLHLFLLWTVRHLGEQPPFLTDSAWHSFLSPLTCSSTLSFPPTDAGVLSMPSLGKASKQRKIISLNSLVQENFKVPENLNICSKMQLHLRKCPGQLFPWKLWSKTAWGQKIILGHSASILLLCFL